MCNLLFILGAWVELNYFVFITTLLIRGQEAEREGVTFILRPVASLGSGGRVSLFRSSKKGKTRRQL